MPTHWCWCRAFGWKEAATWDRPTVEIDLGVMFGLYDRMTASQRVQSFDLPHSRPGSCRSGRSARQIAAPC